MAPNKLSYLSLLLLVYSNVAIAQPLQGGREDGLGGLFKDETVGNSRGEGKFEKRRKHFQEEKEKLSKLNPDEKLAFIEERRKARLQKMEEKFKSMSDKDKIDFVNKRYAKMREKMESKWNSMSKEEKITFVEEKINRHGERGSGKFPREGKEQ